MSTLARLLISFIVITLVTYLLRGFGLLTFIPGGTLLILIALTIVLGVLYGIEKTKRF